MRMPTALSRWSERDPATLEVTAGLNVAFPELGSTPDNVGDAAKFIAGGVTEVAAGLKAYADAGVGHVMPQVRWPPDLDAWSNANL